MTHGYDVVVVGLGGMGSAAAAHLAKRGQRVLGVEQFALGHDLGSSAGESRVIRKAYFEGPGYVPLLDRAYALWRDLERESEAKLLDLVGVLVVGPADGTTITGLRSARERYDLSLEELDGEALRRRFPAIRLDPSDVGWYEREAGIVFPERAIVAHQRVAERAGAELRGHVRVTGWERRANGRLDVALSDGTWVATERLVVCAGPWVPNLAERMRIPLHVQRNVMLWFAPARAGFQRGAFPVFLVERPGFPRLLYGFPDGGDGFKVALHGYGETTTPEALDRSVRDDDVTAVRIALDDFAPGAAGALLRGKVCMYTLTPDEHFVIDRDPNDDGVIVAGGFSGHGFKFCSVVGEIVADLAEGRARPDVDFLRLERFRAPERT